MVGRYKIAAERLIAHIGCMHGSRWQKFGRLAGYLLTHPQSVSRYLRQSVGGATPMALQLPWISYGAIDFLQGFLQPEHSVLEFGGGGSTVFFSQRVKRVLCLESSPEWAELIEAELKKQERNNVTLEVRAYPLDDAEAYAKSDILRRIEGEQFDVILVDGYEAGVQLRPISFARAERSIRPGGVILVDDSWRYPELRTNNRALRWQEFRSPGPCRPGVTSTDVYFY